MAGWPGDGDTVEQSRLNPEAIADHGIDDVTAHLKTVIDQLPSRPILIGHSFGGMLAEKHRARGGHPVQLQAVPALVRRHRPARVRGPRAFLTIDSGWREVADACLNWLEKQGL